MNISYSLLFKGSKSTPHEETLSRVKIADSTSCFPFRSLYSKVQVLFHIFIPTTDNQYRAGSISINPSSNHATQPNPTQSLTAATHKKQTNLTQTPDPKTTQQKPHTTAVAVTNTVL